MNTMLELLELFSGDSDVDLCAGKQLVFNLQAIVTIANAYIKNYTGPGGDEIAPMGTIRMLALKCLEEEVSVK